jgi:hypothetical protein
MLNVTNFLSRLPAQFMTHGSSCFRTYFLAESNRETITRLRVAELLKSLFWYVSPRCLRDRYFLYFVFLDFVIRHIRSFSHCFSQSRYRCKRSCKGQICFNTFCLILFIRSVAQSLFSTSQYLFKLSLLWAYSSILKMEAARW